MVAQALQTARAAGVTGQIIVRGDTAYGSRAVVRVCRRSGAVFSLVLTKKRRGATAIDDHRRGRLDPGELPGCGA